MGEIRGPPKSSIPTTLNSHVLVEQVSSTMSSSDDIRHTMEIACISTGYLTDHPVHGITKLATDTKSPGPCEVENMHATLLRPLRLIHQREDKHVTYLVF